MARSLAYSPLVADHFARPRHGGGLPAGPGVLVRGEAGSREEGTWVVFEARVLPGPGEPRLEAVAFRAFGCPHTIAACSLAAERLAGAPVGALAQEVSGTLAVALEVPPEKAGRLLILEDALRNCLADWDNARLRAGP